MKNCRNYNVFLQLKMTTMIATIVNCSKMRISYFLNVEYNGFNDSFPKYLN